MFKRGTVFLKAMTASLRLLALAAAVAALLSVLSSGSPSAAHGSVESVKSVQLRQKAYNVHLMGRYEKSPSRFDGNNVADKLNSAPQTKPVDVIIAVDESASIKPAEMTEEQQAARLIALGEFAPGSKMGVLGFGGADAAETSSKPQRPIDQVCPLTQVNTASAREVLSDCIGKLKVRTYGEGWNTDFVSAINQASSDLKSEGDSGRPLLMFMLTDGHLDLSGDPAYSGTAQQVQAAAEKNLTSQALPTANGDGVEIWPLGFGPDADASQLKEIAAGGAQGSCLRQPGTAPRAIIVSGAAQVEQELQATYATARCLGLSPGGSADVSGGQTANLAVSVPVIATDGSIEVIRQNPRIQVSFFDPHGHEVPDQGSFDQSTFQLGGADSPVEALSITDPLPGVWHVKLHAPPGVASTAVNASALWQGVLRSDIVVVPPQPRPGQRVMVQVRLQVRGEVLVDSAALAGVTVRAQISGTGFSSPAPVSLSDNGQAPNTKAGDGVYSGYLSVPRAATGSLNFAGVVTGRGVVGDERHFTSTTVAPLSVGAQITLSPVTVPPGGTTTGSITLNNSTGAAHTIRLLLHGTPPGVTITPATVRLPAASGTLTRDFVLRYRSYVPHGPVAGTVTAVDAASPNDVYAESFIGVTVALPKPWWQRYWWTGAPGLALLLVILFSVFRAIRARRRIVCMEDIEMVLYQGGQEIDSLPAPAGCGSRFAFSVEASRSGLPRLGAGTSEGNDYVARREGSGLALKMPEGEVIPLPPDDAAALGDGTALGFRDLRLNDPLPEDLDWTGEADDPEAERWEELRPRRWWHRNQSQRSDLDPADQS